MLLNELLLCIHPQKNKKNKIKKGKTKGPKEQEPAYFFYYFFIIFIIKNS